MRPNVFSFALFGMAVGASIGVADRDGTSGPVQLYRVQTFDGPECSGNVISMQFAPYPVTALANDQCATFRGNSHRMDVQNTTALTAVRDIRAAVALHLGQFVVFPVGGISGASPPAFDTTPGRKAFSPMFAGKTNGCYTAFALNGPGSGHARCSHKEMVLSGYSSLDCTGANSTVVFPINEASGFLCVGTDHGKK